jgi:hypothetical protein
MLVLIFLTSCSWWFRIGDLSMISNKNIEKTEEFVLFGREVEGEP